LSFFMNIRVVIVFFMLTPAIALHWIVKSKSKNP
jgi:hypothetical protein